MTKNTYFKYALIAIVLVFLAVAGLLLLQQWEKGKETAPETETPRDDTVLYQGETYVKKTNVETFLVLGLDKSGDAQVSESYNNDLNADFLMLFVLDHGTKQYSAIHINRDTIAEMNVLGVSGSRVDTVTKQIALSHNYGNGGAMSCRNTADAVSKLLNGVKINHYMSLKMDAVGIVNDLLGGVTLELLEDFSNVDPAMVKGAPVTLNRDQALHYVRTRYELTDSTNSTRMIRQKQYINAMLEQFRLRTETDHEFSAKALLELADYMVSDRSATQLQSIVDQMQSYTYTGISDIAGESKVGEHAEFYPDEASILDIVIKKFYELAD